MKRITIAIIVVLLAALGVRAQGQGNQVIPAQGVTGGGTLQGTFTGGPIYTISSISENGATVTVTTSGPCALAINSIVLIAGVPVTGYNSPGGPTGPQGWVITSGCGTGSTFQYVDPTTGLSSSSGGTATGSPLFLSNLASSFLTTGTGAPTTNANVAPINREERCGTSVAPITLIGLDANAERFPCGHISMFFGAPPVGLGYSSTVHRMDGTTPSGYDVANFSAGAQYNVASSTNAGGTTTDNATAQEGAVVVCKTLSTVSCYADTNIAQGLTYAGLGPRSINSVQNLSNANRSPVFYGDTTGDNTVIESNVLQGGQSNTFGSILSSSVVGKGFLNGGFVADAINVGHSVVHGAAIAAPNTGYWGEAATKQYVFLGYNLGQPTNQGNAPVAADTPTFGTVYGEQAANSGQSNVEVFYSTNAGTACTLNASPNGLSETGNVVTGTCNAAISGNFAVGSTVHLTGLTSPWPSTLDGVITTVASPSFTFNTSYITTPAFNITGLSESSSTVTVTTSATCPFTAGENVTIANAVNANLTSNNGYNGTFAVVAGCAGGSTFTYTNTVTGLPTCSTGPTCVNSYTTNATVIGNPLPASGGGTATASARQAFSSYFDSAALHHFGYASPPNGNGTDAFTFGPTTGQLKIFSSPVTSCFYATSGGATQMGSCSNHRVDFLQNSLVTWSISASGQLGPLTDGGDDLGATASLRPNNGFFKNNVTVGNAINAAVHQTATNCAAVGTTANPSVASCTAAAAGSISCAATETSCQVNTSAVTANSEIFLSQREDTTTGTRLGVTCNTTPSTVVASQNITAVTAGTSFTFAITAPTTNPDCFSYFIVN